MTWKNEELIKSTSPLQLVRRMRAASPANVSMSEWHAVHVLINPQTCSMRGSTCTRSNHPIFKLHTCRRSVTQI